MSGGTRPRGRAPAAALALALAWLAGAAPAAASTNFGTGAPFVVYTINSSGTSSPGDGSDAATFNAQTSVFGSTTPAASATVSSSPPSRFGGSPGSGLDETASGQQASGESLFTCGSAFTYGNASGCIGATGSGGANVIVAVQSWPFFVDASGSSNVTPGTFALEYASDDGSWFVLAPNASTYAQPANFQGATGLTAGTAVVHNGVLSGGGSVTGTFAIAAQATCSANLYYLTYEYFEGAGGGARVEYSWTPPGGTAGTQIPQGVVYGRVLRAGAGVAGDAVTVSVPGGATQSLTTDSAGCYGYNYAPFSSAQTITVSATDQGATSTKTTSLDSGQAQIVNFAFGAPQMSLTKRLTKIVRGGATIVPTPDPTSPAGMLGTSSYAPGVLPGDVLTFTIYFANVGASTAYGPGGTSTGPTLADALQAPLALVSGSGSGSCCVNPSATNTVTATTSGQKASFAVQSAIAPYQTSASSAYEGSVSLQATVP